MRVRALLLAGLTTLAIATTSFAADTCLMLGWSGGPGTEVQWTKATIEEGDKTVTIHYNWQHGIMRGTTQADGSLEGNWIQDDSPGGLFKFKRPQQGKAEGWWTNAGEKQRYPMVVQGCS
jgi:hypothetical protein